MEYYTYRDMERMREDSANKYYEAGYSSAISDIGAFIIIILILVLIAIAVW